jgi:hypothetical protein
VSNSIKPFLVKLLILTIVIVIILLAGESFRPEFFAGKIKWVILAVFVSATALQHYFMMHPDYQKPAAMVRVFMASSAIKLMAYVLLIVVFIVFFRPHARKIIIWFLAFYMIFTVFENALLFKHFRSGKKD